jgi:hypothetical protein
VTDRLLEAREFAERLAVPVSWGWESIRSGAMPCAEDSDLRPLSAPGPRSPR